MSKFQEYLKKFDLTAQVTDEELAKTQALLRLYAPVMRQAARNLDEFEEECYEMRSQSITDFINLAIDYDNDADRKRIAGKLASMGHSMQLLSLLEETLLLVKNDPAYEDCYELLRTRYFDVYCKSNEDAFLTLGISSATYYRNIKKAVRVFAGNLWCVVIPDLMIREQLKEQSQGQGIPCAQGRER